MKRRRLGLGILLVLLLGMGVTGCQRDADKIRFGGGPAGGLYDPLSREMAQILEQNLAGIKVEVERSGGSVINLARIEKQDLDMAFAQSGDLFAQDFEQVRALARMHGAVAKLAVLMDSRVRTLEDLKGARVAVGPPGSGAAKTAEQFFRQIGLWEAITPVYMGYSMAVPELLKQRVQALWQMTAVPSASLQEAATQAPIRLLDLGEAARSSGFYKKYPFYSPVEVPAGSYRRFDKGIASFEDGEIWVASRALDEDLVFRALQSVFSEPGLARIRSLHPGLSQLSLPQGLTGVHTPLHAGAERFWQLQGQALPPRNEKSKK